MKRGESGSVFARFENYWGSGEKGCIQILRVTGVHEAATPGRIFHKTEWLGHTCDNPRPAKTCSIRLDWAEQQGEVLWLKPR